MKSPFGSSGEVLDMRLSRMQFSVKRMMIAVMLAAVVMGGVILKRRRDGFLAIAAECAAHEAECLAREKHCRELAHAERSLVAMHHDDARGWRDVAQFMREHPEDKSIPGSPADAESKAVDCDTDAEIDDGMAKQSEVEASYHRSYAIGWTKLKLKYKRAAQYPWIYIDPEPPPLLPHDSPLIPSEQEPAKVTHAPTRT